MDICTETSIFNFNRLFQIGLRYLDQRQALVNAAVAVLPGAPDLSIFFRFWPNSLFLNCLISTGYYPGGRAMQQVVSSWPTLCSSSAMAGIPRSVASISTIFDLLSLFRVKVKVSKVQHIFQGCLPSSGSAAVFKLKPEAYCRLLLHV